MNTSRLLRPLMLLVVTMLGVGVPADAVQAGVRWETPTSAPSVPAPGSPVRAPGPRDESPGSILPTLAPADPTPQPAPRESSATMSPLLPITGLACTATVFLALLLTPRLAGTRGRDSSADQLDMPASMPGS